MEGLWWAAWCGVVGMWLALGLLGDFWDVRNGVGPFKKMAGFLEGFMSVFLLRECAAECACMLLVAAKAWLAGTVAGQALQWQ